MFFIPIDSYFPYFYKFVGMLIIPNIAASSLALVKYDHQNLFKCTIERNDLINQAI